MKRDNGPATQRAHVQGPEHPPPRIMRCGVALKTAMLCLWIVALVGYFGPWIARRPAASFGQPSAALSWNAYDLYDLLRLLPEIEGGALTVHLQALQMPLLALAVLLPILASRSSALVRVGTAVLGSGLAAFTLPPYPEIVTAWKTPGWCVPFWWGVGVILCVWGAVWAAPKMNRTRSGDFCRLWLCMGVAAFTAIPAATTLTDLLPALRTLHAAPVSPGWGFWSCTIGLALVGILAGFRAFEVTDERHA